MEAKELLLQLERLEECIYDFSFDQLTTSEALDLREKFNLFKLDLNHKIFNDPIDGIETPHTRSSLGRIMVEKMKSPICQMVEAITRLKKTSPTENQSYLIESLELATMVLTELTINKNL